MKVTSGASQSLAQAQAQAESKNLKNNTTSKDAKESSSTSLSAQVSLSPQAQQIKKATELAQSDNVDEAKIAKYQSLIDSGKYQIDAAKIADRLVDEHLNMPS